MSRIPACTTSCQRFLVARSLPAYTTVDTLFSRSKQRWLLAVEKLASLGYPVTKEVAEVYGTDARFHL